MKINVSEFATWFLGGKIGLLKLVQEPENMFYLSNVNRRFTYLIGINKDLFKFLTLGKQYHYFWRSPSFNVDL